MIVRFPNFVIFLNLLAIAKEFHIYVTLILQSTEVHWITNHPRKYCVLHFYEDSLTHTSQNDKRPFHKPIAKQLSWITAEF